jgi:hypothetical protein
LLVAKKILFGSRAEVLLKTLTCSSCPSQGFTLLVTATFPSVVTLRIQPVVELHPVPFAKSVCLRRTSPQIVVFPLVPSSIILAPFASVFTQFDERNTFLIVITALSRFVGMLSDCANVTPAKVADASAPSPKISAERGELK